MFKKNKGSKPARKPKKEKAPRSTKKREKAPKAKREKAPRSKSRPTKTTTGVDVIPRKMNVYESMLVISFCCIMLACMFLYFELSRYGSFFRWWPQ